MICLETDTLNKAKAAILKIVRLSEDAVDSVLEWIESGATVRWTDPEWSYNQLRCIGTNCSIAMFNLTRTVEQCEGSTR